MTEATPQSRERERAAQDLIKEQQQRGKKGPEIARALRDEGYTISEALDLLLRANYTCISQANGLSVSDNAQYEPISAFPVIWH